MVGCIHSIMTTEKTLKAFRKVARRCHEALGCTRTNISFARKVAKLGLVHFSEASRYRREEFGRPVGPVFVTVSLTELGEQVSCASFTFHTPQEN